ncbi:MAG: TonB-dependent receptor [Alphaproteobacteria bacterium]|nr:TonB-dependent receptor [Alphaproteobacteria bacterium]
MRVPHSIVLFLLLAAPALAQTESVTVTADPVHLMERAPGEAATGLLLPLADTPRAASQVSETTLNRYGVEGLDDLTAITPSSYTSSFYGVEGAVNLRGTLADNYFRGFRRAENRGTYATPLTGDVTILRGPPSPVYGAGKVGGLVDVSPAAAPNDSITVTYGAYEKRNLAAEGSLPITLDGMSGRLSARGEIDDSFSFYRGIHPSHQALTLGADLAAADWTLSVNYAFYHADGEVQTPGWNRLTRALIDSGTYIIGRNTSLKDADGNGRLTLNEFGGNPYAFDPGFKPLAIAGGSDAAHRLDSDFGTTQLDPRTIYIARGVDFSRTATHTGFVEVKRDMDGDSLRLQLFADTLANDRFVSYGYPTSLRAEVGEVRLRYDFDRSLGDVTAHTTAGLGWRFVHAIGKQSFNSGVIALDRRDIAQGPAANDIIDSPFNNDPPGSVGLGWETNVASNVSDAGLFALSDLAYNRLHLLLSGRLDQYNVRSRDTGVLAYEPAGGAADGGRLTWSASLSWRDESGLMPYFTHAQASAPETGQAGEVPTQLLVTGGFLSASTLDEAGVKYAADGVEASLSLYRQSRTQLSQLGGVHVSGTRGEGVEAELRWLISDHISTTVAASLSHTFIKGPDHSFAYVPARTLGVAPQNGFGGAYIVYDFSALKGAGDYDDTLIPHAVVSPWLTYSGEGWGASFGGTWVGTAKQTVPDPIVFPAHVTANLSAFVSQGAWRLSANIDNLFDARSFTPDADTYANLGALPGMGRRWRIAFSRGF